MVLQQQRLRPTSPTRAALSRAGHTVRGVEGVNDGRGGQRGIVADLAGLGGGGVIVVTSFTRQ